MIRQYNSRASGFTLVELMLAMVFISMLLLAIAFTVIRIGDIYNSGATMKSVNQSGRSIVDDMRRTIGSSRPFDLATHYNEARGRLCTGTYSYVWNSDTIATLNQYESPDSDTPIKFTRVRDNGARYCVDAYSNIKFADATELLSEGNLAMQILKPWEISNSIGTGSKLYGIRMVISDADKDSIFIDTIDTTSCKAPNDPDSNINFCAINQFEFTALAGNGGELNK